MSHTDIDILHTFKTLKLYGMADAFADLTKSMPQSSLTPQMWLETLLKEEVADRKVRSINYQMSSAKFPVHRDIDRFDFEASVVEESQIRTLYSGQFIEEKRNLILVGGTGTGKSHLAIALASQAVQNNLKARFYNVVDLVKRQLWISITVEFDSSPL